MAKAPDPIRRFVRSKLNELLANNPKWTNADVARHLGVGVKQKAQVYRLIDLGQGYGPLLERAVADTFYGGSIDALRAEANAWLKEHPEQAPPRHVVVLDHVYSSLQRVLDRHPEWDDETRLDLLRERFGEGDPGEEYFESAGKLKHKARQRVSASGDTSTPAVPKSHAQTLNRDAAPPRTGGRLKAIEAEQRAKREKP